MTWIDWNRKTMRWKNHNPLWPNPEKISFKAFPKTMKTKSTRPLLRFSFNTVGKPNRPRADQTRPEKPRFAQSRRTQQRTEKRIKSADWKPQFGLETNFGPGKIGRLEEKRFEWAEKHHKVASRPNCKKRRGHGGSEGHSRLRIRGNERFLPLLT